MALSGKPTIFTLLPSFLAPCQALILLTLLCIILFSLVTWFLNTELGFLLRAVGDTPQMLTNVGKSIDRYTITGLRYLEYIGSSKWCFVCTICRLFFDLGQRVDYRSRWHDFSTDIQHPFWVRPFDRFYCISSNYCTYL